ncbi:MAG TPA: LamG-like jellyroll fold domain-containing protein, partial [Verrucomicrobiae bacterium]|nr:LamG-like jellyroll fold domain-containing protein [Verrucomicrobiae bacterium]
KSGRTDSAIANASFTISTEPPGSIPIPGLALWLRADAGVVASGSAVSQWQDQSGHNAHANQSLGASQPSVVANAINGLPVIQFDGGNDFLTFDLPVTGLGGMTVCLVSANTGDRTGGATEGENAALFWNESQSWGAIYLSPFQTRVQFRFGTTQAGNLPTYVRSSSLGVAYSRTVSIKNGSTDSLYVNGELAWQESGKLSTITGAQSIGNLGRGYNNNSFFPGQIAEVLVYSRALSDAERQDVESYLETKYFVTSQVATPTISPYGGSFSGPVTTTLQTGTSGAEIRFTLDGTMPVSSSPLYTAPFQVSSSATVTARGFKSGLTDSAVATVLFTIGPPPSAAPPTNDLALWLRADAGVIANGSAVSQWQDQSGRGVHANQSMAANQPTLVANAINGKPILQFDGVNDFLSFNLALNNLSGATFCLVSANTADRTGGSTEAENAALFWNETQAWGATYLSPFQNRVQFRFGTTQMGNLPTYIRPDSLGSSYSRTIAIKNGTTDTLYVNGSLARQETGKQASLTGGQSIGNVGRGYNNNSFFPGQIAEVLVYSRALTDAERQDLESYLGAKYFGSAGGTLQALEPKADGEGAAVTLHVEPLSFGVFRGVGAADAGQTYEILRSTDLFGWEYICKKNASLEGILDFSITNTPGSTAQFYRARRE